MIESVSPKLPGLLLRILCLLTLIGVMLGATGIIDLTFFLLGIIFGFPAYFSLLFAKKYFLTNDELIVTSIFGLRKRVYFLKDIKFYTIKLKAAGQVDGYADLTIYTDYGSCNISSFGISNFSEFYLSLTTGRIRNFALEERWLRNNKIYVSLFYVLLPLTIWSTIAYLNLEKGLFNRGFFLFTALLMIPVVVYSLEILSLRKETKK